MAYLQPANLHCPSCGFVQQISTVVGVGPGSEKGDTPYRTYRSTGDCIKGNRDDGNKDGTLRCPHDDTVLWSNVAGKKAQHT